jgi:aspartyl-tRNA(Asn)/glutamyl-tRNA(Gln) amidotransferase subunit C
MPIDSSEVLRIAKLARLHIEPEEATALAADLQRIVESIDQLNEVELPANAESLTYFDSDVHREDRTVAGLSRENALLNAPDTDGERFCVPQIVDKDEE